MKKENADAEKESENPSDPQVAAESKKTTPKKEKPRKAKKEKPKKEPQTEGVRLPVLVEFTYTVSSLVLIVLAITMIVISVVSGASLLQLVIRTSVAVMVMGGLLIFISSQVSSGVLQAALVEQEEASKAQAEQSQSSENPANIENPDAAEVA